MKYIVIDNVLLVEATSKISYTFGNEFVGRHLKDNYEDNREILANGYFQSETLINRAISLGFEVDTDDDGYIESVTINKYQSKYFGHGKPVLAELKSTKKDESEIRKCLNNSIEFTLNEEYDDFINELKSQNCLPNEYRLTKITSKEIILTDKDNKLVSLSKDLIRMCLALSHEYIDLLYDKDIYLENEQLFEKENVDPLLSVLSCHDYSNYHNLQQLKEEAERRKIVRESRDGYAELVSAVKENNAEKVAEYAQYSRIYEYENQNENVDHPLILAVSEHPEYVGLLLDAGSYANPEVFPAIHDGCYSALDIVYNNKDYELMQLIADCYDSSKREPYVKYAPGPERHLYRGALGSFTKNAFKLLERGFDFTAARILYPHTTGQIIPRYYPVELDMELIKLLCSCKSLRVLWERKHFEMVSLSEPGLFDSMIKQGCEPNLVNYFIDIDDYDHFNMVIEKWVNPNDNYYLHYDSFKKVFQKDPKWHEALKKTPNIVKTYDNRFISELFDVARDRVKDMQIKYNIDISGAPSVVEYLNSLLKDKK